MAKLLLVEDDPSLSAKIKEWLAFEHHNVDAANDGDEAWEMLQLYEYDAIVMDWNLPGTQGIDLCMKYRLKGGKTPILMLTGKDKTTDKVQGLDAGADDYMVKPFQLQELSARVRALLRRPAVIQPKTVELGPYSLDSNAHRICKNGKELSLLPKEFAILEFLMSHPTQLFSSRALLERVWGADSNATEETVRTYIKTLRRKICDKGEECPIRTVHWLGYKFEI